MIERTGVSSAERSRRLRIAGDLPVHHVDGLEPDDAYDALVSWQLPEHVLNPPWHQAADFSGTRLGDDNRLVRERPEIGNGRAEELVKFLVVAHPRRSVVARKSYPCDIVVAGIELHQVR